MNPTTIIMLAIGAAVVGLHALGYTVTADQQGVVAAALGKGVQAIVDLIGVASTLWGVWKAVAASKAQAKAITDLQAANARLVGAQVRRA